MIRRFHLISLALASLTFTLTASAEPFRPKMSKPTNYKDVLYGVDEVHTNIGSVQCGGWTDTDATVDGSSVTGEVPLPEISQDLPGRTNENPLGAPATGLGVRGEYQFPDTTFGYLSACDIRNRSYFDEDLKKIKKDIKLIADDSDPDGEVDAEIVDGGGTVDINPFGWCLRYDKATPKWCRKLYRALKRLSEVAPDAGLHGNIFCPSNFDDEGNQTEPITCADIKNGDGEPELIHWCPTDEELPQKSFCFDFTEECHGGACRTPVPPEFGSKLAECHFGTPVYEDREVQVSDDPPVFETQSVYVGLDPIFDNRGGQYARMSSFYRHYAGEFLEPKISVTAPTKTWNLRAECYEYYHELDPKDTVTGGPDEGDNSDGNNEQCEIVIATPDEENPDTPEWLDGVGHKQKEAIVGDRTEPPRDSRPALASWILDSDTNLAMIGTKKSQSSSTSATDATSLFGVKIQINQRGSKTVPDSARTDMFDDTDHRGLSTYWEAQEKELLAMVRDPTTRLIMPARFLVGLDEKNPLYQYVRGVVSKPDGTVELTLRAGPEDLKNALEALRSSEVLPVNEVRIPILLPLASIEELDRTIAQWQQWKELELRAGKPENTMQVDDIIQKLDGYRRIVIEERKLRGALEQYVLKLFGPIRDIDQFMADWYKANTGKIKDAAGHSKQRQQLKRIWRHIQNSMLQSDECQLQWCSNQRFSVPIYSLLDNWWGAYREEFGGRRPGEPRDQGYLPPFDLRDIGYQPMQDQVFDFSFLDLPSGELNIPVLWPIQVKLKLPLPPMTGTPPQDLEDFPDIPDLPDASVFDTFPVPLVSLPEMRVLEVDPTSDLEPAKEVLRNVRVLIDGKSKEDQLSEENEEEANGGILTDEGSYNSENDRKSMRGAYCRFTKAVMIPPNPDVGNREKIIYTESELTQTVARLFARWMPIRTEDMAGRVVRLQQEFPSDADAKPPYKEDIVCAALLAEKTTTVQWQLFFPDFLQDFTDLVTRVKSKTLPENEKKNPYMHAPKNILDRLFPDINLPIIIDLLPDKEP